MPSTPSCAAAQQAEQRRDALAGDLPRPLRIRRPHDQARPRCHADDEVRVMTVHGAKGLEAPVVVLIDGCDVLGARSAAPAGPGPGADETVPGLVARAETMTAPVLTAGARGAAGQGARGAQPPALRRDDARGGPARDRPLPHGRRGTSPRSLVRDDPPRPRARRSAALELDDRALRPGRGLARGPATGTPALCRAGRSPSRRSSTGPPG